jgi:hypothetical protein
MVENQTINAVALSSVSSFNFRLAIRDLWGEDQLVDAERWYTPSWKRDTAEDLEIAEMSDELYATWEHTVRSLLKEYVPMCLVQVIESFGIAYANLQSVLAERAKIDKQSTRLWCKIVENRGERQKLYETQLRAAFLTQLREQWSNGVMSKKSPVTGKRKAV